jgi:hypothetical protein
VTLPVGGRWRTGEGARQFGAGGGRVLARSMAKRCQFGAGGGRLKPIQ